MIDKETGLLLPMVQAEREAITSLSHAISTRDVLRIMASTRSSIHAKTDSATNFSDDHNNNYIRPDVISVRISKPTVDMALGMSFKVKYGELQIGRIHSIGPLADSPLQGGDRLISLDKKVMVQCSALDAAQYIRSKVGALTIVTRTVNGDPGVVEAAVYKQHPFDKLGIAFCSEFGRLHIKNIVKIGLLGDSVLAPGDYVETINSVDVSCVDKAVAVRIVRAAEKIVTIRARKTFTTTLSVREMAPFTSSQQQFSSSQFVTAAAEASMLGEENDAVSTEMMIEPAFVSVKVSKDPFTCTLGITLSNPSLKELKITKISEQGSVGRFPLRPGCTVLSINGLSSLKWTWKEAQKFIEHADGVITLILHIPSGNPAYVQAMASKPTAWEALGITLRTNGGPLHIIKIQPDGILADSVLSQQDTVIAINGIPCQHMSVSHAIQITQQNPELVCILAKPHQSTGIVLSHVAAAAKTTTNKIHREPNMAVLASEFLVGF